MLCKCRLCGKIVTGNRSSHLRRYHKIDSRYKGAVRDYFLPCNPREKKWR